MPRFSLAPLLRPLAELPDAPPIADAAAAAALYRRYRLVILGAVTVGYAAFYLVRKNYSVAMPSMARELGLSPSDLGLVLSLHALVYGVGKLGNGLLAARANPRWLLALGLLASAALSALVAVAGGLGSIALLWLLNGWAQSMGSPPCVRSLRAWYPAREMGLTYSLWNCSHMVGGAAILAVGGWLTATWGWRAAFLVPAAAAALVAVGLAVAMRDRPETLGLPPVDAPEAPGTAAAPGTGAAADAGPRAAGTAADAGRRTEVAEVLANRTVWALSIANFWVYVVRGAMIDWAPTFLQGAKELDVTGAGLSSSVFEVAGLFAGLLAGWLSDRVLAGNRGLVALGAMLALIPAMVLLWRLPAGSAVASTAALAVCGLLIYMPHMLIGLMAAQAVSLRSAALANGMTGFFGYLGAAVSGWGTGLVVQRWGWDGGFALFTAAALVGTAALLPVRRPPRPAVA